MEDTIPTTPIADTQAPQAPVQAAPTENKLFQPRDTRGDRGGQRGGGRGGRGGSSRGPRRDARTKPEFDQKIVSLRRVVRVTSGGRRFAFSACVDAGNRKGMVGVGLGKATDTPLA